MQKDVSKGFPEWLERVEVPKKDGTVHHPLVTDTRSLLWVANQNSITPHVWIVARAGPVSSRHLRLRSRSVGGRARGRCAPRRSRCAICSTSWAAELGQDLRLEGLPHRRAARRQERRSARSRGFAHAVGTLLVSARSEAPHAGVQQGRSRRPHPRRHRPQRLQRDVRRGLRGARRSPARRCRRRARGTKSRAGRSARTFTLRTWRHASRRSAICGPTCAVAGDR